MTFDMKKATAYNRARPSNFTEERLAKLVAGWQKTHHLLVDGSFGPKTIASVDMSTDVVEPPAPAAAPVIPRGELEIELVDWIAGLTVDQVEARWARISRLPIEYVLSGGGRDPIADDPRSWVTRNGKKYFGLDCTGAGCYAMGLDRFQPNFAYYGGWQNTDSIVADARGKQQIWELLDYPVRGCAVVFPGINLDDDDARERIGHYAWAAQIDPSFDRTHPDYFLVTIWDCAGSNSKLSGAVGDVFRHPAGYFNGKETFRGQTREAWRTIPVWFKGLGRPA